MNQDFKKLYTEYGEYNTLFNQLNLPSPSVEYAWRKTKNALQKEILNLIENGYAKRVTDLGCGNGALLLRVATIANRKDVFFEGHDLSRPFVEFANTAAKSKELLNIKFVETDLESDWQIESDVIVSSEVLEHVNDPKLFLDRVNQALKPGGYFLLTTPNSTNWIKYVFGVFKRSVNRYQSSELKKALATHEKQFVDAEDEQHIKVFGQDELIKTLNDSGFEVYKKLRSSVVFGGPTLDNHSLLFGAVLVLDWVFDKLGITQVGWDNILFCRKS